MIGALVRAAPRTMTLAPCAVAMVGVAALSATEHRWALLGLQTSIVALAMAAVALLDEPPLPALPVSRARRRALLLGTAAPVLALLWLALLAVAGVDAHEAGALTLQLATVVALSLAAGSVIPIALAFCAGRVVFGPHLFPAGTEAAGWSGATGWWAGATCAGLIWLAASSRD